MQFRQGDILFEKVDDIPASAQANPERGGVVAYGEHTGHVHEVVGEDVLLYEIAPLSGDELANRLFANVPMGGTVTHQEHGPIELPPGRYEVIRQREYTGVEAAEGLSPQRSWDYVVD